MRNKLPSNLAALYLGCPYIFCFNKHNTESKPLTLKMLFEETDLKQNCLEGTLVIRPFSEITDEEAEYIIKNHTDLCGMTGNGNKELAIDIAQKYLRNATLFQYLLSRGFDLGLLPQGSYVYGIDNNIVDPVNYWKLKPETVSQ